MVGKCREPGLCEPTVRSEMLLGTRKVSLSQFVFPRAPDELVSSEPKVRS